MSRSPLRVLSLVLIAVAAVSFAPAQESEEAEPAAQHRSFSDAAYWAGRWDADARRDWQKPVEVLAFLGLVPGDVVADLGAGTGYFTQLVSLAVYPEGKVYAVDVEQAMLDHVKQRDDAYQEIVVPVLAAPDDPKLPESSMDLVLVVNTWHHIEKRSKYLKKLARVLTPTGRLALVDFRMGALPVGPPEEERVSQADAVREFEKAGWTLQAESRMLPYQYLLILTPPKRR